MELQKSSWQAHRTTSRQTDIRTYRAASSQLKIRILSLTIILSDLHLAEAVDVPVGVHHLDDIHGRHGDLCGDCKPISIQKITSIRK